MSVLDEERRRAIIHAAEREQKLEIDQKPINDPQILGTAYSLRIKGQHLGWTSAEGCREARELYNKTPSRLRHRWRELTLGNPVAQLARDSELAVAQVRRLEASLGIGDNPLRDEVASLRALIEVLHEQASRARLVFPELP